MMMVEEAGSATMQVRAMWEGKDESEERREGRVEV